MKIGIPNILAIIGFCFACGLGIFIPYFLLKDVFWTDLEVIDYTLMSFLIVPATFVASILGYKFKLLLLIGNKILFIYPFRLKVLRVQTDRISSFQWEIKQGFRMGDYRTLKLTYNQSNSVIISDLEFSNFNQIEIHLLNSVNFEPNLAEKNTVQISQAKTNRSLNYVAIVLISIFLLLFLVNFNTNNTPQLFLLTIIIILILRLTTRIKIYNSWLRNYENVRKRRLKKLGSKD